MNSPEVVLASYREVADFAGRHSREVFHEPTALGTDQLFGGLDPVKLKALQGQVPERSYGFFLRAGGAVAGWHLARQHGYGSDFLMESTGILPRYQGQGLYKILLAAVVEKAGEEGYASILSTHAANNNRIIVSKLRFGFFIKGFEINPKYGLDVKLVYYFNEGQTRAHELRVGSRAVWEDSSVSRATERRTP